MAVGAFEALKERGLRIPQDVSVLGFDDMELAKHLRPALSTMALPHYEMGRWACERLLSERVRTRAPRDALPGPDARFRRRSGRGAMIASARAPPVLRH